MKLWMSPNGLHGSINGITDISKARSQRFARPRELHQRIEKVRHAIHGNSDLLVKFFLLLSGQVASAQELRVRKNGSKGVSKVVRDGTRHAAYRRKPLRIQQVLRSEEHTSELQSLR